MIPTKLFPGWKGAAAPQQKTIFPNLEELKNDIHHTSPDRRGRHPHQAAAVDTGDNDSFAFRVNLKINNKKD
jgi:hypothetical protein